MNAVRDKNFVPVALGWDGTQVAPLKVNPVTGRLLAIYGGNDPAAVIAQSAVRDGNHVVSALAVSTLDPTKTIPVHCNDNGLLCKSN